jgi:flagellar assembly factor FliW
MSAVLDMKRSDFNTSVTFVQPRVGFGGYSDFALEPLDESGVLFSLSAVHETGPHMFLLDPAPFFPQYVPVADASVADILGTDTPRVLVIVTPGSDASEHTANLLAPVLVNPETGAAMQAVLEDDSWPLRAPFN